MNFCIDKYGLERNRAFEKNICAMESLLEDDDKCFESADFTKPRDAALDEHRQQRSEPLLASETVDSKAR
ncbi:MAG TPA: hypothetical protein PKA06_10105 [Gemmatales bacterium]|nr:hypothetical protein [Gemmatales bacterium]HMP18447.1 hypothetical protein [Gemmatales bacterium]